MIFLPCLSSASSEECKDEKITTIFWWAFSWIFIFFYFILFYFQSLKILYFQLINFRFYIHHYLVLFIPLIRMQTLLPPTDTFSLLKCPYPDLLSLSWFFWMSIVGGCLLERRQLISGDINKGNLTTFLRQKKLALNSHPGRWSLPATSVKKIQDPKCVHFCSRKLHQSQYIYHVIFRTHSSPAGLPNNWHLPSPWPHFHDVFWDIAGEGKCHFTYRLSTPYCLIFLFGLFLRHQFEVPFTVNKGSPFLHVLASIHCQLVSQS